MSGTATSSSEVTAFCHVIPMDAGLYCVSLAEPAQLPPMGSRFPAVRLSLPPGPESDYAGITISTFRADGWLDMERPAALVHVAHGPASVMLTIYHEASQPRDMSPRLVITQLGQPLASTGSTPPRPVTTPASAPFGSVAPGSQSFVQMPPTPPQVVPGFGPQGATHATTISSRSFTTSSQSGAAAPFGEAQITAHIRNRGDVQVGLTDWVGLPGSRLWVEGFGITLPPGWSPADLEYQGIIGRGGATPWITSPEFCGSRAQTMPLLGLAIRLRGNAARLYDLTYRASFIDGSTAGPAPQGQLCQSPSGAAVEAFQISITRRAG
jgi:hypothetical protein